MNACLQHRPDQPLPLGADDNVAPAPAGSIINCDTAGLANHTNGHQPNQSRRSTPLLIRTSSGQQHQKHRRPATNVPPQPAVIACHRRPTLSTFRANSNVSRKSNNLSSSSCITDTNNNNNCDNFTCPLKQRLPSAKAAATSVIPSNEPLGKDNTWVSNIATGFSSTNYPQERNSLESIHSKFSISSANDQPSQLACDHHHSTADTDAQCSQTKDEPSFGCKSGQPSEVDDSTIADNQFDTYDNEHCGHGADPNESSVELSTFSEAPDCKAKLQMRPILPNVAVIATKYVSPPTVDGKLIDEINLDTQLQRPEAIGSKCCWRNIPLGDSGDSHDVKHHLHHYVDDEGVVQANGEQSESCAAANGSHSLAADSKQPSRGQRASSPVMSHKGSAYKKEAMLSKSSLANRELVLMASEGQKGKSLTNRSRKSRSISQDPGQSAARGGRGANNVAPFPFAGILASIMGSVFISISVLCVKLLPDESELGIIEKTKALFIRGCSFMVLCGATIILQRSTFLIRRDELLVNVLRAIFGVLGVYGLYISLRYISLGDATALVFSSPIWTSILSHLILKEPFQWIQLLALPASMFGILLIAHPALIVKMDHVGGDYERQPVILVPENSTTAPTRPMASLANELVTNATNLTHSLMSGPRELELGFPSESNSSIIDQLHHNQQPRLVPLTSDLDSATMSSESSDFEHRWPGILIALSTSLIVSLVYIVLKFRKTTPIQTTTFWLGFASAACSLLVMCFVGFGSMPASLYEWSLLLGNGFTSWLGQAFLQWALMHEDASILSVVRTLDVAMTFSLSALFLDEEILWTSVVGATIIGLVVVSIVMNSWIRGVLRARAERHEGARGADTSADDNDDTSNELSVIVVPGAAGVGAQKQAFHAHKHQQQAHLAATDSAAPTPTNANAAA